MATKDPIEKTALLAEIGQAVVDAVRESGLLKPRRRATPRNNPSKRKSNPNPPQSRKRSVKTKTKGRMLSQVPANE